MCCRKEAIVEEMGELCLQEEVARLREEGLSTDQIARKMGVDPGWVESLIAMIEPEEDRRDGERLA